MFGPILSQSIDNTFKHIILKSSVLLRWRLWQKAPIRPAFSSALPSPTFLWFLVGSITFTACCYLVHCRLSQLTGSLNLKSTLVWVWLATVPFKPDLPPLGCLLAGTFLNALQLLASIMKLLWACLICESDSFGFCSNETRSACTWKQSEKSFKKVDRSLGVLNIRNHCSCGKLDVIEWKSWKTIVGPWASIVHQFLYSFCIDWWLGKLHSLRLRHIYIIFNSHQNHILNVSGCLLRKFVNSSEARLRWPRRLLIGTSVPIPYWSNLFLKYCFVSSI